MPRFFAVLISLALLSVPLYAQVDEGDELWSKRAEGARGARAASGPIDAAIAAYQRAVDADPENLEARWKLMRALRFKGAYTTDSIDEKKKIFDRAKNVGQDGMKVLDDMLVARGVRPVDKAPEKQVAMTLRAVPHAASFLYWDAASWGEWAQVFGKFAAVRQGVADRIRRESTIVRLMDRELEGGGGARILGRLHHQTPRVPFLTGWASNDIAVKNLTDSLEQDPTNKLTKVFLAEALVAKDPSLKPRAVELLREVLGSPNLEEYAVEQAASQEDARALLKQWGY